MAPRRHPSPPRDLHCFPGPVRPLGLPLWRPKAVVDCPRKIGRGASLPFFFLSPPRMKIRFPGESLESEVLAEVMPPGSPACHHHWRSSCPAETRTTLINSVWVIAVMEGLAPLASSHPCCLSLYFISVTLFYCCVINHCSHYLFSPHCHKIKLFVTVLHPIFTFRNMKQVIITFV